MDYPIQIDTLSMELSILGSAGQNCVFLSLKIVFVLANSSDPDEMRPYAAFHLGLQCLPKDLFTSVQNEKGYTIPQFMTVM